MMGRWTFAQRVGVGLCACVLAALLLVFPSATALSALLAGGRAGTDEASTALLELEHLRRAFASKLAHTRAHALSGDPAEQLARQAARRRFQASLEALGRGASDAPHLRALLARLADAERLHEDATHELQLRKAANLPLEELEWWSLEHLAPARLEVERHMEPLAEALRLRLDERLRLSQGAARGAQRLLLLTSLVGLLGVGALALLLRRTLVPLYRRHLQSEERLRLLLEGVQDYALCFLGPDGRVEGWSAGAERLTGYASEEVDGWCARRLHAPEDVAQGLPQAHLERAGREGRLLAEGWRVRRDGSRFWAETLLTALRDERGRLRGFAEVTRDITERRRTERLQALLAEAGRALASSTERDALARALVALCVPAVADACVLLLPGEDGRPASHALAHSGPGGEARLRELLELHPEALGPRGPGRVAHTGRAELLRELDPPRLPRELRESPRGPLLRELGVRSCLTVPLCVGPRVLGALCLLSTQPHRRYGAVDQVLLEELATHAALALDNARLLAEAQGALELIGVAAHDLGSPLCSLQLRLQRLLRAPEDTAPSRLREGLAQAEHETRRLGQLVHTLLDVSRLSAGRLTLDTEPLQLDALAREVLERHAEQAQAAGCALSLHAPLPVAGRWDGQRLERVLTNLLSNALKFGRGQPVEVRVLGHAEGVRLVVRDSGAGIPPEAQQRIFGRFERAHPGLSHAGVGLGLYIVRQLVEAHGGSIHVRSQPGQGAEFTVDLPREPLAPLFHGIQGVKQASL